MVFVCYRNVKTNDGIFFVFCYRDLTANNWVVFAGAHDLMAFESSRSPYAVVSVILHQSFDINTFDNDIALLKLARPIRWSRYVRPVCLPPPNFEFKAGTRCNILGWGMASKHYIVPLDMKECMWQIQSFISKGAIFV